MGGGGKWRFHVGWGSKILQNGHFLGIAPLEYFIGALPLLLFILHTVTSLCQVLFTRQGPIHEKM